jgi:hypothetical protein
MYTVRVLAVFPGSSIPKNPFIVGSPEDIPFITPGNRQHAAGGGSVFLNYTNGDRSKER